MDTNIPDSCVDVPGFTNVQADRDTKTSGKKKGGGVIPDMLLLKRGLADVELLAVGLRPYYVPREFSQIIAIVVSIPPPATAEVACDIIHEAVVRL